MNKFLKIILITGVIVAGIAVFLYYRFQSLTMVPRDLEDTIVYIPTNSTFEEVVDSLTEQGVVRDEVLFRRLADYMEYERDPMRAGRYEVQPGWNMIQLIRHLRGGEQAPVQVTLTTERMLEDVAGKAARYVESDSADFMALFNDEDYLREAGFTRDNLMTVFIPNTYQFYWDTDPRSFMDRMQREHRAFWDKNDRRAKAERLGLTPEEVYTLASIVEKETLVSSEKARIAGVYLNRLKIGMRLQADPTSVFATRDFDTGRVTYSHTEFDSPYNTYRYKGLPPGPIAMPAISTIDAVLDAENHDYLYFCAVGDGSGLHAFAETLEGHNRNAQRYRENLRERGLR